ncbi:MAG: peptidylprolyl isomerase [Patescibacteria group bacterium]
MIKEEKKVKPVTLVYSVIIFFLVFLVVVGVLIYKFGMSNRLTQKISQAVPFPAAIINAKGIVRLSELDSQLNSVRMFYENQDFSEVGLRVDFKTPDGKKRLKIKEKKLLNKLIENRVISDLAREKGIKISSDIVTQEVTRKIDESGSRDSVTENLKRLYGWDIKDFEEKMVKPDMYKQALEKSVKESDENMVADNDKITEALNALKNKEDFSETAKKYSEGDSAKNGGDLGWLTAEQMIPEIAVASFLLDKGARSDIIESPIGFHIIKVEDKKTEEGMDKFKIRQILVRSKTFADWLLGQEKSFNIYIPLDDFRWDKESQSVQFTDREMIDFENNLEINSPDDISVLF